MTLASDYTDEEDEEDEEDAFASKNYMFCDGKRKKIFIDKSQKN